MAGLQRSAVSFRRQGSSGLVWDDSTFLSGELNKVANHQKQKEEHDRQKFQEQQDIKPSISISIVERSRSNGGERRHGTGDEVSQSVEPPSPRVSACGFCGALGRPPKNHRNKACKARQK